MRVATAPSKNMPDMPRRFVVEDGRAIDAAEMDIAGLTEIRELTDYSDIMTGLCKGGNQWEFSTGGLDRIRCNAPIVYRTDLWEKVNEGYVNLHRPHSGISAWRDLVWIQLRRVARPALVVTFSNVHFVADVWGAGDNKKADYGLRLQLWHQDYRTWARFLRDGLSQGEAQVSFGDFNKKKVRAPVGMELAFGPSVEDIWVGSTDAIQLKAGATGSIDVNSDHHVRWATIGAKITRPTPPPPPVDPVAGVINAWTVTGPSPEVHRAAQNKLRTEWPPLASALDTLASSVR